MRPSTPSYAVADAPALLTATAREQVTDPLRGHPIEAAGGVSTHRFLSASALLFGSRAVGASAGFATQILLARLLSADDLGTYFFATSVAAVVGLVAAAGYPDIAIRFFARYRRPSRHALLAGFIRQSRREIVFASIGGVLLTCLFALLLWTETAETRWAIAIGALAIPAFALNWINSAYAVALRRFSLSQLPDILGRPVLLLIAIGVIVSMGANPSVLALVALVSGIAIAATAAQALWLAPHLRSAREAPCPNRRATNLWRRASLPLIVVSLFTSLFADLDLALLGMILRHSDLAIFGICLKLAFLVGFVTQVIQQFASPDMAEAQLRGDARLFRHAVANANYVCVGATVVILAGVVVLGDDVLAAFGPAFVSGYPVFVALTFAQVIRALFGPSVQCLTHIGAGRVMVAISAFSVALLALANLFFATEWGPFGAAVAVVLTTLVWHLALAIALHRLTGLRTDVAASLQAYLRP